MSTFWEEPINYLINSGRVRIPLPGNYRYCGVGTDLKERRKCGDLPINALDTACLDHDISYEKYKDLKNRHIADRKLEQRAGEVATDAKSSFCERASALVVSSLMTAKRKMGFGLRKKRKTRRLRTRNKVGGILPRSRKILSNFFARVPVGPRIRRKRSKRNFLSKRKKAQRELNF